MAPSCVTGAVVYDVRHGSYSSSVGEITYGSWDTREVTTHGYASFDLSGFPDSASVVGARLYYYQYDGYANTQASIVLVPSTGLSPHDLYEAISSGTIVDQSRTTPNGPVLRTLNSTGVAAVDSCVALGADLCIGWNGGYQPFGRAFGAPSYRPERACLEILYATPSNFTDISVCDVTADSFPRLVGQPTTAVGRITNTGNSVARDIMAYAAIEGAVSDSVLIDSIAPGETTEVSVVFLPCSQPGGADLLLYCVARGDWCRHNDTARQNVYAFPSDAKHAEGFETRYCDSFPPAGWADISTNGWRRNPLLDPYRHTGSSYALSSGNSPCEDWLISPGLHPTAETADTLGFFYGHGRTGVVPRFQVWVLGSQDPYDVLGLLLDTLRAGPWCEARLSLDAYDERPVYVGFRKFWNGTTKLDDIWFTTSLVSGVEDATAPLSAGCAGFVTRPSIVRRGGRVEVNATDARRAQRASLVDATGKVVSRHAFDVAHRHANLRLETRELPAGVYHLVSEPQSGWSPVPIVVVP